LAKILLLDIETKPALAYVWGIWKENIGIEQIKSPSEMICWAAKWYGSDKMYYKSVFHNSKKDMLKTIHKLLNEADIVVHFNGRAFDIRTLNKEFITNRMNPTSPYRQIDLIETARHTFNFQSNKLDFLCQQLGIGKKEEHEGFGLWKKCMENDPKAWNRMKVYNIKDVLLTEELYERLRPWIHNHPNIGIYDRDICCPNCGSKEFTREKDRYNKVSVWTQYRCKACHHYFKGNERTYVLKPPKFKN
jgi:hypothetical protein